MNYHAIHVVFSEISDYVFTYGDTQSRYTFKLAATITKLFIKY